MKIDKRKLLGPLFKPLSKTRHSIFARVFTSLTLLPGRIIRERLNRPYFSVNIAGKRGMGALLRDAIQICNYAEQHKLTPRTTSNNPLYASEKNTDVIQTYFGPEGNHPTPKLYPLQYFNRWSFMHLKFAQHLSISQANRLFWTYLAPKPFIADKASAILNELPGGKFDMAVHYRGTDKALEAPLVNFSVFENEIAHYQDKHGPLKHVFLATDEPAFEAYIRDQFPAIDFQTYNLAQPADVAGGRHFSNMTAGDKATEAIVNMLLLAGAPCLLRNTSYMSAICKIINPAIRTITVNRSHWGSNDFPEREILEEEQR